MLPKKAADEVSGELLARGYWRMLGERLSEAEMSSLTEIVLERCKWFPTVAECNEIMGEVNYANPFYVTRRHRELDRLGYTDAPRITHSAAQGIETGTAETEGFGPKDESPVPERGCARTPETPSIIGEGQKG